MNDTKREMAMKSPTDIKTTLVALPGWAELTAYERSKAACRELTMRGESIPMWQALRELIGKGSSLDINRGKTDFRKEHGESLRAMATFPEGMPETVKTALNGAWGAMVVAADTVVKSRIALVIQERDALESRLEESLQESKALQQQLEAVQAEIAHHLEKLSLQERQIETLEAARSQSDAWLQEARQDAALQREEMQKAVDRLEGVETHMLRRIEETRQEIQKAADRELDQLKAKLQDQALELARARRMASDAGARAAVLEREAAAAVATAEAEARRAERAENALAKQKENTPAKKARRVFNKQIERS